MKRNYNQPASNIPEAPAPKRAKEDKSKEEGFKFKSKEIKPFATPPNFEPVPQLKIFDPTAEEHKLPKGFLLILEGSRRIGKSEFLKWLLFNYQDEFDLAIVLSETPHNGFWQPIVGNKWVHDGWNPYLVIRLIEEQIKEKKREQDSGGRHKMRRVLMILDDIIGDKRKIHEDTELNRLAVQGRHFGISVCLTTQDPHAINPTLRNNTDVAIIFQQKNFRGKESIYNDFINIFEKKIQAVELMKRYTKDHDCIVVENHKLNEVSEQLYFHSPGDQRFDAANDKPKVPEYQIGSDQQKRVAKTKQGQLPLFLGVKD